MIKKTGVIAATLALVAAAAIGVRSTAALFTDKDEATINVTSGKVSVKSTITDMKLYSAISENKDLTGKTLESVDDTYVTMFDEDEHLYYSELKETSWSNGGTAIYEDSVLTLDRITAGDKIVFSYDVSNESNVNIKYQFSFKCISTEEDDLALFDQLVIKYGNIDVSKNKNYASTWTQVIAGDELEGNIVSIMLPLISGNNYQNLSCSFKLGIEAVQANAHTIDPVVPETTGGIKAKIVIEDIANAEGWEDLQVITDDITLVDPTNIIRIQNDSKGKTYHADTKSVANNETHDAISVALSYELSNSYFIKEVKFDVVQGQINANAYFFDKVDGTTFVASMGEHPNTCNINEAIDVISVEITLWPYIRCNFEYPYGDLPVDGTIINSMPGENENVTTSFANPATVNVVHIENDWFNYDQAQIHFLENNKLSISVTSSQYVLSRININLIDCDYGLSYFSASTGFKNPSENYFVFIKDSSVTENINTVTLTALHDCIIGSISVFIDLIAA